jgi:hypothetical protein
MRGDDGIHVQSLSSPLEISTGFSSPLPLHLHLHLHLYLQLLFSVYKYL